MEFFRGIVKIKYGGEKVKMILVQEPRDNGSTEDEDFTSDTETESSTESDHRDVDLLLTIRDTVDNAERNANTPLVEDKVAHFDEKVQKQVIASLEARDIVAESLGYLRPSTVPTMHSFSLS